LISQIDFVASRNSEMTGLDSVAIGIARILCKNSIGLEIDY
jgi:hypothetical protein